MKLALLSALFAASAYANHQIGAHHQTNWASSAPDSYNCDCHCDCAEAIIDRCDVDYLVLLDAASCVRNAWTEMLNRVRNLAQTIEDNGRKMAQRDGDSAETRFGVIRYAARAPQYDIKLDDNLSYKTFSRELSKLTTWNEGSYLAKGWTALEEQIENQKRSGRKLIVIVVTNGISHPHPDASPEGDEIHRVDVALRRINKGQNGLFINTIIKPEQAASASGFTDNAFGQADLYCSACEWNHKLFITQGKMDARSQVFYKSKLEDGMMGHIQQNICPKVVKPSEVCNNCECECEVIKGQPGPDGENGLDGLPGDNGVPGQNGVPGRDGAPGLPGPDGANGCDGGHGNPGHHGEPGQPGQDGNNGGRGIQGCPGSQGPKARMMDSAVGPQGPQGPQGPAGPDGGRGNNGMPGQPGEPGVNGPQGKAGQPGDAGRAGQPGRNGGRGQPGQPGDDGPDGVDGAQGANGDKGRPGARGEPGLAGSCGAQGSNGSCGKVGRAGPKGVPGMPGATGQPGQSGNANHERMIRQKVAEVVDRLLPKENSGARNEFFCKCQAYSLFNAVVERFNF